MLQDILEFSDQVVDLFDDFTTREPPLKLWKNDITSPCQLNGLCRSINSELHSQWRCYTVHDLVILSYKWTVIILYGTEVMSESGLSLIDGLSYDKQFVNADGKLADSIESEALENSVST